MEITGVRGDFVASVAGIDLSARHNNEGFKKIETAFETYAVLIFPNQYITDDQQIDFSRRFGPLEPSVRRHRNRSISNVYLSDISNVGPDGTIMAEKSEAMAYNRGNQLWHSDSSFKKIPAKASLLSAKEVPPYGGETEFSDMRAVWDSLDKKTKNTIDSLYAEHCLSYSRSAMGYDAQRIFSDKEKSEVPPVLQPLVRQNKSTGRKSLYVGSHAARIPNMKDDEGRALLDRLLSQSEKQQFIHVHVWSTGDLVMWDNRCVNHRGRPWESQKYRRVMRRTTVGGEGFDELAALAI